MGVGLGPSIPAMSGQPKPQAPDTQPLEGHNPSKLEHWAVESEVSQWVGNVKPSTHVIGRCGMFNRSQSTEMQHPCSRERIVATAGREP